jgi:hypothetical protein
MLKDLMDSHPLIRFLNEHPGNKTFRLLTYGLPAGEVELKWFFQCHLDRLDWLLMIEGERAAKHGISDAAEAPDIASERIGILLKDFWSHIA